MSRIVRFRFTLPEILVVIAIIAVLIGLLVPARRRIRESAARVQSMNNIKNLALSLHGYHDTHKRFPPGCLSAKSAGDERLSWMVAILPFVEQDSLFKSIEIDAGYQPSNATLHTPVSLFLCPEGTAESPPGTTNFVAMSGLGKDAATLPAGDPRTGFMGNDRETTLSMISDGTSNTIALMDTHRNLGPWARGGESNLRGYQVDDQHLFGEGRPFGVRSAGAYAAMADGSVLFVNSSISPSVLAGAFTIAGGEPRVEFDD